jgi:putative transposase
LRSRGFRRVLEVSRSGYYAWRARPPSHRSVVDAGLSVTISQIHASSRGTYGAPRVHAELTADHGVRCGRKRVTRLMRHAGLVGCHRRRAQRTTRRDDTVAPAPDLVHRSFAISAPDRLWVADITYLPTWQGFLYLAVVLDVFSRKVNGWAMADHLRSELVVAALEMALWRLRPAAGVVHHSDRGAQYSSQAFGKRCRQAKIVPSMGSIGDCYDNALAESLFATLECELVASSRWRTHDQARTAVFDFIKVFYDAHHRHSALGYLCPASYERRYHRTRYCLAPTSPQNRVNFRTPWA